MKIETDYENGGFTLKEVFTGVNLVTEEGNWMSVCMRDDTFELNVGIPSGGYCMHRVDPKTGTIVFVGRTDPEQIQAPDQNPPDQSPFRKEPWIKRPSDLQDT